MQNTETELFVDRMVKVNPNLLPLSDLAILLPPLCRVNDYMTVGVFFRTYAKR